MISVTVRTKTTPTSASQFGTIRASERYGMKAIEPAMEFGINNTSASATSARMQRSTTAEMSLFGSAVSDMYITTEHKSAPSSTVATYHLARMFIGEAEGPPFLT